MIRGTVLLDAYTAAAFPVQHQRFALVENSVEHKSALQRRMQNVFARHFTERPVTQTYITRRLAHRDRHVKRHVKTAFVLVSKRLVAQV